MASGKNSFVLYCDLIHVVKKLPKDKAGELLITILEYVNDLNPVVQDFTVELVFEPIKQQLKRDLIKWEGGKPERVQKAHNAGVASGEARRSKKNLLVQPELGSSKSNLVVQNELNELGATKRTANVSVSANVSVNDNVKRESNGTHAGIENSNLFRKPKIPTKHEVMKAITDAGGDKVMAKAFFEKHEGTGWFINGSPIVNYVALAQKFVTTWKSIDDGKKEKEQSTAPPLKRL